MAEDKDSAFLQQAIDEANASVADGGGPFGALVVRDGKVLGRGANEVTKTHDPTAHAEVVAIRAACRTIADHSLQGATLYASTEPCPLCLAASYWARLSRVVYGASRDDAARAGFDDAAFYREIALPPAARSLPTTQIRLPAAQAPLDAWIALPTKIPY